MRSVEQALADYTSRCDASTLDRYPLVWAGHYNGDEALGQFGIPTLPKLIDALGHVAFGVMHPFGYSPEIESSYLVIDALRAPSWELLFETSRVLYVSRLADDGHGVRTTHWIVPFEVQDFRTVYAEPEQCPYFVPKVEQALSMIADKRLERPNFTFDEAYGSALELFKEMYQ